MKTLVIALAAAAALGLAALAAARVSPAPADRPDCPGKIVCPQTDQLVCRDECRTVHPDRADCPGRIVCPLTGELVCTDRCPAEQSKADATAALPSCCQGKR
jgi:hypothetical protein